MLAYVWIKLFVYMVEKGNVLYFDLFMNVVTVMTRAKGHHIYCREEVKYVCTIQKLQPLPLVIEWWPPNHACSITIVEFVPL